MDPKWTHHFIAITKKETVSWDSIRQNLRRCRTACKRNACLALLHPLLEYGAIIWDPFFKEDIDKLETVLLNAVRFIVKDYRSRTPGFVTGLLHKHNLPTLRERREHQRVTFLVKTVEGLVPAKPADTFWLPQNKDVKSDPADQ